MRRDHVCPDLGVVSVSTLQKARPIVVGRRFIADVTYTAGPKGIEIGGALRFKLPGLILGADQVGPVSCSNPKVGWTCSNHLPETNGKSGSEFFTINYVFIVIQNARLNEGDTITIRYGDQLALRHTAAPQEAQKWPVEVAVDIDGSCSAPGSGFFLVENPPLLEYVNDRPAKMEVFVPSYTRVDECFRTTIRLKDQYNNLAEDYIGTVTLVERSGEVNIFLGEYSFEARHRGVLVVENTVFKTPGIHRLTAEDKSLGIFARSNPTKTTNEVNREGLFWGDTHCHSSISADTAANNTTICRPAEDYDYARNRSALDFCTVTDHIEDQSEEDWRETREAARDANEPVRFVTFSAFEATYRPLRKEGDKNVYFFDDDQEKINQGTTEELYENLKQRNAKTMVIPHLHCLTNWDRHDPDLERVVEVYAHWGCGLSEETDLPIVPGKKRPPHSYVQHALEQGAKLGFIASADHSHGHPGDDFWWNLSDYNGGLAAVYSPELTRQGIWDALWNRHCYATTRARILQEFEVNGHMMGEAFSTSESARDLRINVYGTSAIASIEIIKNGRVLQIFPGERRLDMELEYRDETPERETDYYYVHVCQEDGEQAWSSPVWVKYTAQGR